MGQTVWMGCSMCILFHLTLFKEGMLDSDSVDAVPNHFETIALLSTALMAYGFSLRHAFDVPDAIDNVMRKLM
jgi:high-affinity nickel permease